MRLSWEISTIESSLSGTSEGGVRKDRPGRRKTSMTETTSAIGTFAISAIVSALVDRRAPLLASHARNEIESRGHSLGQVTIAGAIADEIGTHRQHDVDRQVALLRRFQQQLHESGGVILPLAHGDVGEAKQLFELIDNDEQVVAVRELREAHGFDQAETAAPQPDLHPNRIARFVLGVADRLSQRGRGVERARQIADGV